MRRLPINLSLAAVAVGVTLGAAELLARAFVPAWAPTQAERNFWDHDPVLGWTHHPGERGRFVHRDFDVAVAINDHGLRDDDHPYARVPGQQRMLVLGDSFAWGFGVERDEIFHSILERRHPGWELVNGGVSGYGTDQQLLWWVRRGVSYRPDVVLLLLHEGDLKDNNHQSRYGYRKAGFVQTDDGSLRLVGVPVEPADVDRRVERYLLHNTWLLGRVFQAPRYLRLMWAEWWASRSEDLPAVASPGEGAGAEDAASGNAGSTPDAAAAEGAPPDRTPRAAPANAMPATAQDPPEPEGTVHPDRDFAVTARLLELCQQVAELTGTRLVVVSHPLSLARRPPPLDAVLEPLGVPHLSLRHALGREHPAPLRFEHDMHWTPYGHRVVADAVEAFLVEVGVLPARSGRTASR